MLRHRSFRPVSWISACLLGLLAAGCGGDPAGTSETSSSDRSAPADGAASNDQAAPRASQPGPPPKLSVAAPAGEAPAGVELPAPDPVLGPALVVNGEVVPHAAVRRQVLLGEAGRVSVELKKLEVLVEQEIARRVAAGASVEDFAVTDDEVRSAVDEANEQLKEQYPDEDIDLAQIAPVGADGLLSQVQLTKVFLKVFMPDVHPDEYPAVTLSAFNATENGKVLLDALRSEWDMKQDGDGPETNPMFQQMIFQTLNEYLQETSNIELGGDLPLDVLMRINGQDVTVAEVWEGLVDRLSITDVRAAKQWIVNMRLLREELADVWLTEEEAAAAYEEYAAPFKDTMFTVERVATMIKRFPSIEAFKEFRHAYSSYQRRIADQLTPERLKQFAEERTKLLIGQTQVDVDVILVSAYDFKNRRWKENGWEEASRRAEEVLRLLVEEQRPWDEVLDEYSEFYDPPIAAGQVPNPAMMRAKGRFRGQTRNAMMQLLEESEYLQFLNGDTLTDYVFFEQKEGKLGVPVRGPYGWYIPFLLRRNIQPASISLDEEKLIDMAEMDYTVTMMSRFAQELIEKNEVYGLQ